MEKKDIFYSKWIHIVEKFILSKKTSFSYRELKAIFSKYGFNFHRNTFKYNPIFVMDKNNVYCAREATLDKYLQELSIILQKDKNITYWSEQARKSTRNNMPFFVSEIESEMNETADDAFKYKEVMTKTEYVNTIVYALKYIEIFWYEENYQGKRVFWSVKSARYHEHIVSCQQEIEVQHHSSLAEFAAAQKEKLGDNADRSTKSKIPIFDIGNVSEKYPWLQEHASYWHWTVCKRLVVKRKQFFPLKQINVHEETIKNAKGHLTAVDIHKDKYRELIVGCLVRDPVLLLNKKGTGLFPDETSLKARKADIKTQKVNPKNEAKRLKKALDTITSEKALILCEKLFAGIAEAAAARASGNSPDTVVFATTVDEQHQQPQQVGGGLDGECVDGGEGVSLGEDISDSESDTSYDEEALDMDISDSSSDEGDDDDGKSGNQTLLVDYWKESHSSSATTATAATTTAAAASSANKRGLKTVEPEPLFSVNGQKVKQNKRARREK